MKNTRKNFRPILVDEGTKSRFMKLKDNKTTCTDEVNNLLDKEYGENIQSPKGKG